MVGTYAWHTDAPLYKPQPVLEALFQSRSAASQQSPLPDHCVAEASLPIAQEA